MALCYSTPNKTIFFVLPKTFSLSFFLFLVTVSWLFSIIFLFYGDICRLSRLITASHLSENPRELNKLVVRKIRCRSSEKPTSCSVCLRRALKGNRSSHSLKIRWGIPVLDDHFFFWSTKLLLAVVLWLISSVYEEFGFYPLLSSNLQKN